MIAIKTAGIRALPSVINAAIITSALSAGNTYLYIAARTLRGLALTGQAPRFIAKTNRWGVPIYAVMCSAPLGLLGFLSAGKGGAPQAFSWLQSLISLNNILNWGECGAADLTADLRPPRARIPPLPQGHESAGHQQAHARVVRPLPAVGCVVCCHLQRHRMSFQRLPRLLEGQMERPRLRCILHK